MKKYRKIITFILFSMFIFIGNVFAEEDNTCNAVHLNELRTMAANVRVSYLPNEVQKTTAPSGEHGVTIERTKVLDVKIYNITSRLYIKVSSGGANISSDEHVITLANVGPDGSATIRQAAQIEPITYRFEIFSDDYGCSTKTLRTFKMTLPRFNYYSELDVCKDIPEFYLCQPFTTFKVEGSTFYDKVDEYKAKLAVQSENNEGVASNGNGVVSETITAVSKNKYIVVGIIVAIGAVITILILRKKRSV